MAKANKDAEIELYRELGIPDSLLGFLAAADWEKTSQEVKVDPDFFSKTHSPVEYARALTQRYGKAWLDWESETLWTTLEKDFGSAPSEIAKNKLLAMKTLFFSDAFWKDWHVFEKVVLSFNDMLPLFDRSQPPTPGQMVRAIEEAEEIRHEEFDDEVRRYVAILCHDEGLVYLPPPLDIAQAYLDELAGDSVGRSLKGEISRRWSESRKAGAPREFSEDPVGVQLARLAAIREYAGTK